RSIPSPPQRRGCARSTPAPAPHRRQRAAFGHGVRAPPVASLDPPPLPDPTPESKPGERWRSYRAGPDQWERARALRAQGWSILAIGREISLSPKTVRRLLNRTSPPYLSGRLRLIGRG